MRRDPRRVEGPTLSGVGVGYALLDARSKGLKGAHESMPRDTKTKAVYGTAVYYERKLKKVMERLSVDKYNHDYSRWESWVEFWYNGELHRFDQSVPKAGSKGVRLNSGTDCFAQLVLTLEDLARMVERGIYDLGTWISGMKALPSHVQVPSCLAFFGFTEVPGLEALHKAYREKAAVLHPDAGGSKEDFGKLQTAYDQAKAFIGKGER